MVDKTWSIVSERYSLADLHNRTAIGIVTKI